MIRKSGHRFSGKIMLKQKTSRGEIEGFGGLFGNAGVD
jgi:hypothetical protein